MPLDFRDIGQTGIAILSQQLGNGVKTSSNGEVRKTYLAYKVSCEFHHQLPLRFVLELNEERDVERKETATHLVAQYFVQDNTKSPEIDLKAVLMIFQGRVCRCANTATREMCFRSRVAEVAENNVTTRVDEDVLLLYVSVNNIVGMDVLDCNKLCCGLLN